MDFLRYLGFRNLDCSSITGGSGVDCENLPAGGTRAKTILFNYDEVDEVVKDENGVITDIQLVPGAFGYLFEGLANSFLKSEDFARSATTGLGQYKHKNSLIIYQRTQEIKNEIKKLGNGRFMAAVFNRGEDADAIELHGENVGVQLAAGEIRNAYANDSFFVLNMATPEGETENEVAPASSIGPTYAEGLAMLEALLPTS
jgi:hypothetical protein